MNRLSKPILSSLMLAALLTIVPQPVWSADPKETMKPGPVDADAPEAFTKTESGLKYRVRRKSDKAKPTAKSSVKVMYRGWLDDGTVFDSSYSAERGPIEFPLNRVIKGWTEGLQLVGTGGMIELEIPGDLAYGKQGRPPVIPADATLHFTVELLAATTPGKAEPGAVDKDAPKEFTATKSGLKYRIRRASQGKKPTARSTVKVHYRGWLDNGKVFDQSYGDEVLPIEFPLNQVISGWTEGLQLVGEGGMIELEIPSELGYGKQGAPPDIPGGATLHFLVELLEVK